MDETLSDGVKGHERRRERRVRVAGIAVVQGGAQPPSVWQIANLSLGGASLIADGALPATSLSISLHASGVAPVDMQARVMRKQIVTRAGRCAVKFVDVTDGQRSGLQAILAADHTPSFVTRRALVVDREPVRGLALSAELASLGFTVRRETSPERAAAWLQRESTEVLLVGESIVGATRWSLLQFVRDTAPEIRRFVLSDAVPGFRLHFAMKAGLVEGLVHPTMPADELARHLLGNAAARSATRPRAKRAAGHR